MVELWIPITVAAAFLQCVRTAIQKHLTGQLSTNGASYARFVYGFPVAVVYLWLLIGPIGLPLPDAHAAFLAYCLVGAVTQIIATSLLIQVFRYRNFAVGTTYSKTEAVQTAIFGFLLLGDPLSAGAFGAILVSFVGVVLMSLAKTGTGLTRMFSGLTETPALIGIGSGALFGVTAVSVRAAALSLGGEGFLVQAAYTLAVVLAMQTVLMSVYLAWREPGQLAKVARTFRISGLVGLTGVLGSIGWFSAMTLENAAYVRTLGQVELVFTFIASYFFFRERATKTEIAGILLIVGGIVLLLNFR